MSDAFTDGRYILAWVDGPGARDPIMLTSQVKAMREMLGAAGHEAALVLCVVAGGEADAAADRIKAALDPA